MRNLKLIPLLAAASLLSIPLNADVLTYSVTPNGGVFEYQFTLTNTGSTGGTLFDLFLLIPTDITNIDTTTIGAPVGWGDATGGLLFFGPDAAPSTSFIEWAADGSGVYDLAIGNSLTGFSFTSSVDVGVPITYALNGSTDFATAQPEVVSDTPEPSTFVLFGLGFLVLAGTKSGQRCSRNIWRDV